MNAEKMKPLPVPMYREITLINTACPDKSGNEKKKEKRKKDRVTSKQLAKSNENHSVTFEVKNVGLIFCPLPIGNWFCAMRFAFALCPLSFAVFKNFQGWQNDQLQLLTHK